ncbi:transposase IS66 family protein, partial [Paraburkholderia sp. BL8N3]
RYLDDPQLPVDNNWCENQIRPIAVSRGNWLFAGSARAGKRSAAVMSLIQSVKLNGHDPYAYLKDIMTRLPTQPASRLDELLPHLWQPQLHSRLTSAAEPLGSPGAYDHSTLS